jgi:hypothetical protein
LLRPHRPDAVQASDASLSHSALQATTFEIGTMTGNLVILSFAADGWLAAPR